VTLVRPEYPLVIKKECLSCQSSGHDTSAVLQMFKVACLSCKPSSVVYRDKKIKRKQFLGLRKGLMEKLSEMLEKCEVFRKKALYPRRFFDDILIDHSTHQHSLNSWQPPAEGQKHFIEALITRGSMEQKELSFGIGPKKDFENVVDTLKNTHTTFNDSQLKKNRQDTLEKEEDNGPMKVAARVPLEEEVRESFNTSRNLKGKANPARSIIKHDRSYLNDEIAPLDHEGKVKFKVRNLSI